MNKLLVHSPLVMVCMWWGCTVHGRACTDPCMHACHGRLNSLQPDLRPELGDELVCLPVHFLLPFRSRLRRQL
uniref:Secreted protein n=1 Tax=Arundo donax TaxID=35708 RepID=A0A0A9H0K0_ARUDO